MKALNLLFISFGIFAFGTVASEQGDDSNGLEGQHQQTEADENTGDAISNVAATDENPLCHECAKDPGVCCFLACQGDGHCPQRVIDNGWVRGGRKITSWKRRSFLDA
ncbi:hypothetical protein PV08_11775 [Exophiala spinifera]|uniref:Uncharacterized protein n=1 Tax=Exophiala spinifera TaxID=91928 RepID=A0A0D2BFB3_9EURO|nr:uncharacterized protein PV08_11775 [Exophiala spinifera]KIW09999.1 hypothetical protein PV08_11775 [Exophiala spinifera]